MSLLEVKDLHTHFIKRDLDNQIRVAKALNGVSFSLEQGEVLGLVGETGAGKSLTALSVMGGLSRSAQITQGSIRFKGQEMVGMPREKLDQIRGMDMTIIVQSPLTSLDPLARIGEQLMRVQLLHRDVSREEARKKAVEMLKAVQIPDPEGRMNAWPHEMSGGMAQRVLMALSLVNDPDLLIADEPTTGLDVTVQAQVLDLLIALMRSRNMATIIITHDLGVVANYCTRVAVMFSGTIVESGTVDDVIDNPKHPYTRELIDSIPDRVAQRGYKRIGGAPDLYNLPTGCLFRYRCPLADRTCETDPPTMRLGGAHYAVCHHIEKAERLAG